MRITIKAKLAATFAVVVALSAGSMLIAIQNLGKLNESLETIVNTRAANSLSMSELQTSMEAMGSRTRALILTDDAAEIANYMSLVAESRNGAVEELDTLRGNIIDPQEMSEFNLFAAKFDQYWVAVQEAEEPAQINSDTQALAISRSEGSASLGKVEDSMIALKKSLASRVAAGDLSAFSAYQQATDMFLTMTDIFRQQRNILLASSDPELQEQWHTDYLDGIAAIGRQMPMLGRSIPATEAGLFDTAETAYGEMVAAMDKAVAMSMTRADLLAADRVDAANEIRIEATAMLQAMIDHNRALLAHPPGSSLPLDRICRLTVWAWSIHSAGALRCLSPRVRT